MGKIAVVFIHGLTGGDSTWQNSSGQSFLGMLEVDPVVGADCDFLSFEYYSKVTEAFDGVVSREVRTLLAKMPLIRGLFSTKKPKVRRNQPIEMLANGLSTFLRTKAKTYDGVIIVAHSLGGLVAKDLIARDLDGDSTHKILGFISIAVPHKGSLGALLTSWAGNVQMGQLVPLDRYTVELEGKWDRLKDRLPPTVYLVARNDEIVVPHSAVPTNTALSQAFYLEEDHKSICKPENAASENYLAVRDTLHDVILKKKRSDELMEADRSAPPSYDKEIFVLKLMIADIEGVLIDDAKQSFFSAETLIRVVNAADRDRLRELYTMVLSMYRTEYANHLNTAATNTAFVASIHKMIFDHSDLSLKTAIENVHFVHKKGLLHQLANELSDKVVWNKDFHINQISG